MALIDVTTEVKPFLRINHTALDVPLAVARDGVLAFLEGYCGTRFVAAGVPSHTDYLQGGRRYLWPYVAPVVSVSTITNMDGEDVVDASEYRAETARILRLDGGPWADPVNKFRVEYRAGYTTLPPVVKLAALQLLYRAYHASGGKRGESAFGHSLDWAALIAGDIGRMLRPAVFRRPFA